MATEAVEIVISADDQASKKMATIAANAEQSVKRIKDVGQKTKASTELAGSIANLAGGTQFGAFAGQLGQLTEKVSQFSEVSKAGGAGALAFKAGLIAATAAIGYNVGSALGNWIFQQEELNKNLEKTVTLLQDSANEASRAASQAFKDRMEDITLLPNKNTQKAELQKLLAETEAELTKQTQLWNSKVELGQTDELDKQAANFHKSQMDRLKQEAEELKRSLSGREEAVQKQRELNTSMEKSKDFVKNLESEVALMRLKGDELLRAKAYQETVGAEDSSKAFALLKEKEAIEATRKAEEKAKQDKEQAEAKEKQRLENIESIKKRELDRLEEQRILLTKGEEAAQRFTLAQQGLDEATASRIARETAELKKLEKEKQANQGTQLTANQSRLMARGPVDTTQKTLQEQLAKMTELVEETKAQNKKGVKLVKVAL